ncbi:MAG: HAD family hydrolase [Bacteroidales bacterium]|nr:HAD family hydrolase [Bacteroidales bacterium]MBN2698381.1 HAD family hydrolase [Bacteroidales bacterium]
MKKRLRVIGFDADDTLWINEPYYREAEEAFEKLMKPYKAGKNIAAELYRTEMGNLKWYGYGIKSFILSLVQCAIDITGGRVTSGTISEILQLGRHMLERPIELLEDVRPVIEKLSKQYRLIVATKGDLLDQERKMEKSSISSFFHHIEIMSDKQETHYSLLLHHLEIDPSEFMMIGNSMRSDIFPVLSLGGYAIHVPFHTTWMHEEVEADPVSSRFFRVSRLSEIIGIIDGL